MSDATLKNLIVSSWPSSGGTTMALILAMHTKYKYVYAGGLLKYFAAEIFGADSGQPHMQFEREFGKPWDEIWETYAQWLLKNKTGYLVEGMTAGFLYDNDQTFSIMFKASVEARAKRSSTDGRLDAEQTIKDRDIEVRERWIRDLGVDVYDEELMQKKYELIVDNSDMTIADTIILVTQKMFEAGICDSVSKEEAQKLEDIYWEQGKSMFRENLKIQNLLHDNRAVFKDWQIHFPKLVENLPTEMKQIVLAA